MFTGNEPSDSIRVVNAVLTQIDQIKRHSNVLILTTSNITESIDLAFIDRADIKQYLGLPTPPAIYKVYHSCLEELVKVISILKNLNSSMNSSALFFNHVNFFGVKCRSSFRKRGQKWHFLLVGVQQNCGIDISGSNNNEGRQHGGAP
jgi:hypothetical protein